MEMRPEDGEGRASNTATQDPDPTVAASLQRQRRRVPAELRKRAAVSCDFCRARRRKCVRESMGACCLLCRGHNIDCVSTVPRKRRVSSSLNRSPQRQQLFGAFEEMDVLGATDRRVQSPEVTHGAQDMSQGESATEKQSGAIPVSAATLSLCQPSKGQQHIRLHSSPARAESPEPSAYYERILQNPAGVMSYFGASSSMAFVRKLGDLVALKESEDGHVIPSNSQQIRDRFSHDKFIYTMNALPSTVPEETPLERLLSHAAPQSPSQSASSSHKRLSTLIDALSSSHQTETLVEEFFLYIHPTVTLLHRPSFQAMLDELWSRDVDKIDVPRAVCIRMVIVLSCQRRLSHDIHRSPAEMQQLSDLKHNLLRDCFQEFPQLMLSVTLYSVVACCFLSVYLGHANERNAALMMSGCAVRMAIGLGMHRGSEIIRRSNIYLTPLEKELHKQVWCYLCVSEHYHSAFFGRPSSVDGLDLTIETPKESILDEGHHRPPGYLTYEISLARIVSKISKSQTDQRLEGTNDLDGLPDVNTCDQLLGELEEWENTIPTFLKFNERQQDHLYPCHFRQIVTLQVRYQYARNLLSRPFLLRALYISRIKDQTLIFEGPITKYKNICFAAAVESWILIRCLWDKKQYDDFLSLDGIFAYQCSLTLSLCILGGKELITPPETTNLQDMVRQLQRIMRQNSPSKTIRRFVQLSTDFLDIVSAPHSHREGDSSGQTLPGHQTLLEDSTAIDNTPTGPDQSVDDANHSAASEALFTSTDLGHIDFNDLNGIDFTWDPLLTGFDFYMPA